jgi:hypothetical protein
VNLAVDTVNEGDRYPNPNAVYQSRNQRVYNEFIAWFKLGDSCLAKAIFQLEKTFSRISMKASHARGQPGFPTFLI